MPATVDDEHTGRSEQWHPYVTVPTNPDASRCIWRPPSVSTVARTERRWLQPSGKTKGKILPGSKKGKWMLNWWHFFGCDLNSTFQFAPGNDIWFNTYTKCMCALLILVTSPTSTWVGLKREKIHYILPVLSKYAGHVRQTFADVRQRATTLPDILSGRPEIIFARTASYPCLVELVFSFPEWTILYT